MIHCSRVVPVSFPCHSRVLPVSFLCHSRVVPVSFPCSSLVVPVSFLCCSRVLQEKFRGGQTAVQLSGLLPATDYSVTLYALYGEEPSDPATAVASTRESCSSSSSLYISSSLLSFTRPIIVSHLFSLSLPSLSPLSPPPPVPLPAPGGLQFPMVTHSLLRVSWVPGAVDVPGHRITYSTNHGSDVQQVNNNNNNTNTSSLLETPAVICVFPQVEVEGLNSLLLQNLSSLSRYLVSVQSHYPEGLSAGVTGNISTRETHTHTHT